MSNLDKMVAERRAKTGESYAVALRHIRAQVEPRRTAPSGPSSPAPVVVSSWLPQMPDLPPQSRIVGPGAHIIASGTGSLAPFTALGAGTVTNPPSGILLSTVITLLEKVPHGHLIEVVGPAWDAIAELLEEDPEERFRIPPGKWEELIAASYRVAGYDVTLTSRSGDGGIDVVAVKRGFWSVKIIDQVKALAPGRKVSAEEVRALLGVLHADHNASKGLVTTTAEFAPGIATEQAIQQYVPNRLELIDGPTLVQRFTKLRGR